MFRLNNLKSSSGYIYIYITLALCSASLLSFLILTSSATSADDSIEANVAISVPVSCMMTSSLDSAHSASINAGTYRADIGKTTFKVICNENSGFSIYAIGYSNEEYGNNKLLATVGGQLAPTYDIVTGTAESGTTSNWAMKLNPVTTGSYIPTIENGYSSYSNVPTAYTKVATFNSSTDAVIGASVEATYAAYIASDQPAGNYNGKVKYTMVHPASEIPAHPQTANPGCINYFANTSNAVGTMGCQSARDGDTKQLFASNFSREGYGFAGWSDAFDYATNPNAHFYGPNEDITVPTGTTANGLSLYAVWIKSAGNLQDSAKVAELCGTSGTLTTADYDDEGDSDESTWSITAGLSSISALTDTRDNQTYAIAKLTDGKCWMIENLRLDDTPELSSANTNNPSLPLTNIYDTNSTSNHLSPTSSVAYDASTAPEGWCKISSAACVNQSRIRTSNITSRVEYANTTTVMTSPNVNLYSYGNYYNWYSATAGNGTYGKSGNTSGDLCPTGWHLPTGTGSGEFGVLSNSLGGYKNASDAAQQMTSSTAPTHAIIKQRLRHFPNNILYSGYLIGNNILYRGTTGSYSSSTGNNTSRAYVLYLDSANAYPGVYIVNTFDGREVRCVADT